MRGQITIISKTKKTDYIGGIIDNSGLDKAITKDLTPQEYPLVNGIRIFLGNIFLSINKER